MDTVNAQPPLSPVPILNTPIIYSSDKKSGAWVIVVISIIIILIALGVATLFLSKRFKLVVIDNTKDRAQFDTFYTELPLSLDNPAIIRSSMLYSLYGAILEVNDNNGTIQIVSDIQEQGKNLTFNMIDRTIIQIFDKPNFRIGSIGDIKPGKSMSIVGEYWNLDNKWVINYIVLDTPPDSTPAAKLKR